MKLDIIKTIAAHFITPIVGLLVYQFIITSHLVFPLSEDRVSFSYTYFFIGIKSLVVIYVFLFMISFPIFTLLFRLYGVQLKTCILSSISSVSIMLLIGAANGGIDVPDTLMKWRMIAGIITGTIAYGYVFWLLAKSGKQVSGK